MNTEKLIADSEYKHEFKNDWAQWFSVDRNGDAWEYENKPRITVNRFDHSTAGLAADSSNHNYTGDWKNSLQSRYTDQQMRLIAEGWTMWSAGDEKPKHNLFIDVVLEGTLLSCRADAVSPKEWGEAVAYCPTNDNYYCEGVRVTLAEGDWFESNADDFDTRSAVSAFRDHGFNASYRVGSVAATKSTSNATRTRQLNLSQILNAKNAQSEKVAEEDVPALIESMMQEKIKASKVKPVAAYMPEVGEECEYTCTKEDLGHESIKIGSWYGCTIIAYYDGCVWTSDNGIRMLSNTQFRPKQQSERDKVIEAVSLVLQPFIRQYKHNDGSDGFVFGYEIDDFKLIESLYEAGMLKLPEQG